VPASPAPIALAPTPATSALPVDEALAAVAALSGSGTIRCRLEGLGERVAAARWPFVRADWDGQVLRAVVPSPEGARRIPVQRANPEAARILAGDAEPPLGVLEWSGATNGSVGGCRMLPTERAVVRGSIVAQAGSPAGFGVQVCGERVKADADGRFVAPAWTGEPCLAYVAQPGWTRSPIAFVVGASEDLRLDIERDTSGTVPRRVIVRGDLPAVRALQDPELSNPARQVLRDWAQDGLSEVANRKALANELDTLTTPAPAP
jgi:hypothetical protein